jgi:hypothetical protein
MRVILCLVLASLSLVVADTNLANKAVPAQTMLPTIYDDGKSCPNNCDAHVVFHNAHNGTANAFDPASSRSTPRTCAVGRPCRICFSSDADSCMTATYRGGGPARGRFDFTPAFFDENCSRTDLPAAFGQMCRQAAPAIERLKQLVNCVATPEDGRCTELIADAKGQQAADEILYNQCKESGQQAFNRQHRNRPELQRSNECAYEKVGTGRNSRGETWTKLLPGACRAGTYVGRDGTDCCNGSLFEAALLGSECRRFFVAK